AAADRTPRPRARSPRGTGPWPCRDRSRPTAGQRAGRRLGYLGTRKHHHRSDDILGDCPHMAKIIYTRTDEAPLLATYSFKPVIEAYASTAGVEVETRDISLAGRIVA